MNIHPKDPRYNHFTISIIKSMLRIIAGVFLFVGDFESTAVLLILAEVLGVLEEVV